MTRNSGALRLAAGSALVCVLLACDGGEPAERGAAPPDSVATSTADCAVPSGEVQIGPPGDVQIGPGVGVLRPGAAVADLMRQCTIDRDTVVHDAEGMPQRQLRVVLGPDTAIAEVVADSVWRVRITSRRFRVLDSLGVGTPAGVITRIPGARALIGEGEVYLTIPAACGVSFRVSGVDFAHVAGADTPAHAAARVPDTATVDLMLLLPCTSERANT